MHVFLVLAISCTFTTAVPVAESLDTGYHQVAEPFLNSTRSIPQIAASGANIFRRNSCPSLSLLCPSGGCCSYATTLTTCCGTNCCPEGYLCTGGTPSNPCCVAITDPTNSCGSQNTNPCITPGYLPCSGANFCCPPSSICYFDNFGVPRCTPETPVAPPPAVDSPTPPVDPPPVDSPTPPVNPPVPPVDSPTPPVNPPAPVDSPTPPVQPPSPVDSPTPPVSPPLPPVDSPTPPVIPPSPPSPTPPVDSPTPPINPPGPVNSPTPPVNPSPSPIVSPTPAPDSDVPSSQISNNTVLVCEPVRSRYIPWKWYVRPKTCEADCPSPETTLGTFAAVNLVVAFVSVFVCHSSIVHKWTCTIFGGRNSGAWKLLWLVPLGLQLGANAIIATLYKNTPGYYEGFRISDLVLFWTTRPRFSWIILAMLMNIGESEHKDGYWESAAKSSIIAELVLLLMSTYYMGRTADFAAQKGFYLASSNISGWPRTMYAGALFSLITVFQCTMLLGFTIVWKRARKDGDIIKWLENRIPAKYFFFGLLFLASTSWLASWFFWVGYVMTAGDLYCPPRLATSGIIWAIFSLIGNMAGAGGA